MLITYGQAAELLGLRSRSGIYRKIESGQLQSVQTPDGPRLESEGLPERWANITRTASDSPVPPGRRSAAPAAPPRTPARPPAEEPPEFNVSRARHEFEKANLAELERKQKEALLLPTEQVERAWAGAVTIARTKMLAVPTRARQRIPHLTLDEVAVLEELIREALEDLASGH